MIILGIDPGESGAISFLRTVSLSNVVGIGSVRLDVSERDLCDWLGSILVDGNSEETAHAYLERVSASPGAGVSGMFRFGQSYGALRMLLIAHLIPFDLVQPAKWQQAMGCARPKGQVKESQTGHKNRTKARAQQLFPDIKVTHAIADSLLIAEYGRRLRSGELNGKPSSPRAAGQG